MTYLAVPILCETAEGTLAGVKRAVALGAEMIELRLDYLVEPSAEAVRAVVAGARECGRAVIATCRWREEGGRFEGSEQERRGMLEAATKAGAPGRIRNIHCRQKLTATSSGSGRTNPVWAI